MTTSQIAQVCHEANAAYCRAIGDNTQMPWEDAEDWQRESAIKGVQFRLDNPTASAEAQHMSWYAAKAGDGWVYGEIKDADAKTHPCMVAYKDLPESQQRKDALFQAVVDALK